MNTEMTTRETELEAEIVRLRSVIADVIKAHGYAGGTPIEVMSTPFTPTALPELIEKVEKRTIERCVNSCKSESERWNIRLATANRDASELVLRGYSAREDSAYDCSMAIRALPTGQIKLEELL